MSNEDLFIDEELSATIAEAIQKQHDIDCQDSGPKAPVSRFNYKGVSIESRWSVLAELETMKAIVENIPELMIRRISDLYCDSNCSAYYVVGVKEGCFVPALLDEVEKAIMATTSGHNGVTIQDASTGTEFAQLDPNWLESDEY